MGSTTNIRDNQTIVTRVAMCGPDFDFAANGVESVRKDNEHFVTYTGFE